MTDIWIVVLAVNDFCWLHRIPRGAIIIKTYYLSNEYSAPAPEFPVLAPHPLNDRFHVRDAQMEVIPSNICVIKTHIDLVNNGKISDQQVLSNSQ